MMDYHVCASCSGNCDQGEVSEVSEVSKVSEVSE